MYNFGKRPPRALESFGVAGLLGEECSVFYDSLFTTRHLGRVSDLLSARLRKVTADELRLRALLLYTIFEAYGAQTGTSPDAPLEEPLVVECGIDDEKVAVGVAFPVGADDFVKTDGLAERISGNQPAGAFEEMLVYLLSHSHRVVLRYQAADRRVEIVSLFGIPEKMDAATLAEPAAFEVVMLGESPAEPAKPAAYVELGDLDYPKLLREDAPGAKETAPSTGEFLVKASEPEPQYRTTVGSLQESTALADAIRLRGKAAEPEAVTVVSGVTEKIKHEAVRVAGVTEKRSDEAIRVQGAAPTDIRDQAIQKVTTIAASGGNISTSQARLLIDRIKELQTNIAVLESERKQLQSARKAEYEEDDEDETDEDEGEGEDEGGEDGGAKPAIKKIFKKIWPFKKKDESDGEDGEETEEIQTGGKGKGKGKGKARPKPADDADEADEVPGTAVAAGQKPGAGEKPAATATEVAADSLVVEIEEGSLDRTIHKAQKEAAEIKKDAGGNKTKKWVDGLMEELVQEKARLRDLAKKLNQAIRQKELEFRNKELGFQDELRRRDDMLRQKSNALTRSKEQLAHANMTLERMKISSVGAGEEAHYKIKFNQTQKMLAATREETALLNAKIEELRGQLNTAQYAAAKGRGPSINDVQNIQKSLERATKQAEEFKKANQQLLEKLNEKNKERVAAGGSDELKKRLEAAMKMATVRKKEAEQLSLKVEEMSREEERLKKELAQALDELRKKGAAAGKKPTEGGGVSSPPAAA